MAVKVGISSNHLSRLERGVFQPSIEVVKRLASELDVHVDVLLYEEDQQAIMRVIDSMLTKHRMQKLLTRSATEG